MHEWSSCPIRYPNTKHCNWTAVIEHPHNPVPTAWQIDLGRCNKNQEFCYRYDNLNIFIKQGEYTFIH